MGNKCNKKTARKRIQTSKLVDRLFLESSRTKAGKGSRRATRDVLKIQMRKPTNEASSCPTLKFGSFNVRGLDTEGFWCIEELIEKRDFDVRKINLLKPKSLYLKIF